MRRWQKKTVSRIASAFAFACTPFITADLGFAQVSPQQNSSAAQEKAKQPDYPQSQIQPIRFSPVPPLNKAAAKQVSYTEDGSTRVNDLLDTVGTEVNGGNVAQFASNDFAVKLPGQPASLLPVGQPKLPAASVTVTGKSHHLIHLGAELFEQQMINHWGDRLQLRTSDDRRYSRVNLPSHVEGAQMQMLIDRRENQIYFEGSSNLLASWQNLVGKMDHDKVRQVGAQLKQIAPARMGMVAQAAYLMGFQQVQDPVPAPPQDDGQIIKSLPLQEGQAISPVALKQMGLKGPVEIQIDRVLGVIYIKGDPEDVAQVEKMIDLIRLSAQSSLPIVERIPLVNQTGIAAAELVREAYEINFQSIQGPASISALPQDDGLLVIGSKKAIESIKIIAKQIDIETKLPEGVGKFVAFRLVNMSAIDAKERVDAYFGNSAQDARQVNQPAPLPVVTIADFRSNTLIVKASPSNLEEVKSLLADLDIAEHPELAKDIVKVIYLKNAIANDLARVVQSAINGQLPNSPNVDTPTTSGSQGQGQGQNQQNNQQNSQVTRNPDQSNIRAATLALQQIGNKGKIDGGIMFDVRIVADSNSNSIVVTASEKSMPLIEELVRQLDRLPNAETQIKVYQVVNGDAQLLFDMLQTLFGSAGQQGGQGQTSNLNQLPLQTSTTSDGSTLVGLRFTVDIRTNSIIATGPVGDLEVVNELLVRLDEDDMQNRRVDVYRLSNAPVLDVAETITTWLAEREAQNDFMTGDVSKFNRRVVIVPEVISNSLLISARPEYFEELERIIIALDRRPPMVHVKVMIAEVELDSLAEFGIELGIQDSLLFDRGQTLTSPLGNEPINFNFNQESIGNGNVFRETLAGQAINNLGVGRVSTAAGVGGMVLQAGNESVSVLVRALEETGAVRILSTPNLTTLENLQGRVQVGSRVPFEIGTNSNQDGFQTNTQFEEVGVILGITPRVSPDGMIVMFVDVTNSILGDVADGTTQPQINQTTAQTSIMARHGQTVVFAGLIQETKGHIERGAPILKDLPWIGPLFKFDVERNERKELIIFLTPYVVSDEKTLDQINRSAMDRMHWCLSDVASIYGEADYDGLQFANGATQVYYPDQDPGGRNPRDLSSDSDDSNAASLPGGREMIPSGNSVSTSAKNQNKQRR